MSTYNEVYRQVESLSAEEQNRLLEELAMLLRKQVISEEQNNKKLPKQRLDKWRGFLPKRVDALEFQQELRREWDE